MLRKQAKIFLITFNKPYRETTAYIIDEEKEKYQRSYKKSRQLITIDYQSLEINPLKK